jgi:hypothetical protein
MQLLLRVDSRGALCLGDRARRGTAPIPIAMTTITTIGRADPTAIPLARAVSGRLDRGRARGAIGPSLAHCIVGHVSIASATHRVNVAAVVGRPVALTQVSNLT